MAERPPGRLRRAADAIIPPPRWRVPVLIAVGGLIGIVIVMLHVANATSYLSDDPATCVNCHVMAPQFATWAKSAHREVATCNDCHVPQDNVFSHYFFKAKDGLYHSTIFTLRLEPQVIRIREPGQKVVQQNCIRCHYDTVHITRLTRVEGNDHTGVEGLRCIDCHRATPHGEVNSLSAVPYEHVPIPGPPTLPDWMKPWLQRTAATSEQPD